MSFATIAAAAMAAVGAAIPETSVSIRVSFPDGQKWESGGLRSHYTKGLATADGQIIGEAQSVVRVLPSADFGVEKLQGCGIEIIQGEDESTKLRILSATDTAGVLWRLTCGDPVRAM